MTDRRERYFIESPTAKIDEAERRLKDLRERFNELKKAIPGDVMFDIFADSDAESSALMGAAFGAVKAYMNVVGSQTEILIELDKRMDKFDKELTNMRLEIAEIRRES